MALEGASRPFGFTGRIDVQDDPSHFCPIRTFGVGIEQTQIGDEMFVVIDLGATTSVSWQEDWQRGWIAGGIIACSFFANEIV